MGARRTIESGFTLLELMLVVSIIGILAAVALPAYQDYVYRARFSEGLQLAAPAQTAVAAYYDRWGKWPADNAAATLAAPAAFMGRYVGAVEVRQGVITVRFPSLGDGFRDATLTLRPAINSTYPSGAVLWVCQAVKAPEGFQSVGTIADNPVPNRILPAACRT